MKKILFIIFSFPFFLFGSDEQLDQIINLLKYRDNTSGTVPTYFTMSDYLKLQKLKSPYVENYYVSTSYDQFMYFLYENQISDIDRFRDLSLEEKQKLFFKFYIDQVVKTFSDEFYNYYNFSSGPSYVNPLSMQTLAITSLAASLSSGSSSGGDLGTDSQGRKLLEVLESMENFLNQESAFLSEIDYSLYYLKANAHSLPILDEDSFNEWSNKSPENFLLRSTNSFAAIVAALKNIYDDQIEHFAVNGVDNMTPDFLSAYHQILDAQNRLNGVDAGGFDDPLFKSSVTNSLKNISTNSTTVVDVLKKILEQISKMHTNQSSIADSIYWMTNNFPDEVGGVLPPGSGGGSSNDVWHVWDVFSNNSSGNSIKVPAIVWDEIELDGERVLFPRYDDPKFQPSQKYDTFWREYQNLLDNAKAGSIDGQEFLTGVEIFSMRFLGDISSQLMILNSHIPSKTNLWNEIEDFVDNKIPQEITALENQINGERSKIESLNRVDSVSKFVQPITKVKTAISKLKPTSQDRIIRIPLPSVLSISGGDWLIDLDEIKGYPSLRLTLRFICGLIYTIIFIRTLIVPFIILICLGVRLIDASLGLLFFDDTTAVKVVGEWTANALDIFCHLIGLDTDFKKWAVGIKT